MKIFFFCPNIASANCPVSLRVAILLLASKLGLHVCPELFLSSLLSVPSVLLQGFPSFMSLLSSAQPGSSSVLHCLHKILDTLAMIAALPPPHLLLLLEFSFLNTDHILPLLSYTHLQNTATLEALRLSTFISQPLPLDNLPSMASGTSPCPTWFASSFSQRLPLSY